MSKSGNPFMDYVSGDTPAPSSTVGGSGGNPFMDYVQGESSSSYAVPPLDPSIYTPRPAYPQPPQIEVQPAPAPVAHPPSLAQMQAQNRARTDGGVQMLQRLDQQAPQTRVLQKPAWQTYQSPQAPIVPPDSRPITTATMAPKPDVVDPDAFLGRGGYQAPAGLQAPQGQDPIAFYEAMYAQAQPRAQSQYPSPQSPFAPSLDQQRQRAMQLDSTIPAALGVTPEELLAYDRAFGNLVDYQSPAQKAIEIAKIKRNGGLLRDQALGPRSQEEIALREKAATPGMFMAPYAAERAVESIEQGQEERFRAIDDEVDRELLGRDLQREVLEMYSKPNAGESVEQHAQRVIKEEGIDADTLSRMVKIYREQQRQAAVDDRQRQEQFERDVKQVDAEIAAQQEEEAGLLQKFSQTPDMGTVKDLLDGGRKQGDKGEVTKWDKMKAERLRELGHDVSPEDVRAPKWRNVAGEGLMGLTRGGARQVGSLPGNLGALYQSAGEDPDIQASYAGAKKPLEGLNANNVAAIFGEQVPELSKAIIAGRFGGYPAAYATVAASEGSQHYDMAYQSMLREGVNPQDAKTIAASEAVVYGAVAGALELYGLGKIVDAVQVKGLIRNRLLALAKAPAAEGATEFSQSMAQEIAGLVSGRVEGGDEQARQALENALNEGIAGALVGGGAAAPGTVVGIISDRRLENQSRQGTLKADVRPDEQVAVNTGAGAVGPVPNTAVQAAGDQVDGPAGQGNLGSADVSGQNAVGQAQVGQGRPGYAATSQREANAQVRVSASATPAEVERAIDVFNRSARQSAAEGKVKNAGQIEYQAVAPQSEAEQRVQGWAERLGVKLVYVESVGATQYVANGTQVDDMILVQSGNPTIAAMGIAAHEASHRWQEVDPDGWQEFYAELEREAPTMLRRSLDDYKRDADGQIQFDNDKERGEAAANLFNVLTRPDSKINLFTPIGRDQLLQVAQNAKPGFVRVLKDIVSRAIEWVGLAEKGTTAKRAEARRKDAELASALRIMRDALDKIAAASGLEGGVWESGVGLLEEVRANPDLATPFPPPQEPPTDAQPQPEPEPDQGPDAQATPDTPTSGEAVNKPVSEMSYEEWLDGAHIEVVGIGNYEVEHLNKSFEGPDAVEQAEAWAASRGLEKNQYVVQQRTRVSTGEVLGAMLQLNPRGGDLVAQSAMGIKDRYEQAVRKSAPAPAATAGAEKPAPKNKKSRRVKPVKPKTSDAKPDAAPLPKEGEKSNETAPFPSEKEGVISDGTIGRGLTGEVDGVPKNHVMFKPVKGKNGASIVGYYWASTIEEGMYRDRKVSDWSESGTSTGTGRAIVHHYYVQHPDGKITIEGIGSAQKILGIRENRLQTIARREQARRKQEEENQKKILARLEKSASDTLAEANRKYRMANSGGMIAPEQSDAQFQRAKPLTKDGKFVRAAGDNAVLLQDNGWTIVTPQPAPAKAGQAEGQKPPVSKTTEIGVLPKDWHGEKVTATSSVGGLRLAKGRKATQPSGRKGRSLHPQYINAMDRVPYTAKRLIAQIKAQTPEWLDATIAGKRYFMASKQAMKQAKAALPDWETDVKNAEQARKERRAKEDALIKTGKVVWSRLSFAEKQMMKHYADREGVTLKAFIKRHNDEVDQAASAEAEQLQKEQAEAAALDAMTQKDWDALAESDPDEFERLAIRATDLGIEAKNVDLDDPLFPVVAVGEVAKLQQQEADNEATQEDDGVREGAGPGYGEGDAATQAESAGSESAEAGAEGAQLSLAGSVKGQEPIGTGQGSMFGNIAPDRRKSDPVTEADKEAIRKAAQKKEQAERDQQQPGESDEDYAIRKKWTKKDVADATGDMFGGKPAKQDTAKASDKIEDFGEKMAGARKDAMPSISREITDAELSGQPLSKIWPKSEVDAIEDKDFAAVAHTLRDEIPSKPRQPYKVKRWVEQVKMIREVMQASKNKSVPEILELMRSPKFRTLKDLADKIEILQKIDRENWGRIGRVQYRPDAYRYENQTKVPSPHYAAKVDDRYTQAESPEALLEKIKGQLGNAEAVNRKSKMEFEVRLWADKRIHINKKGDPLRRSLMAFNTKEEAFDFRRNNYDGLVLAWEALKDRENVKETDVRRDENRARVGADHRKGKDATPEMFMEAFGFRGVEFGNWVTQGKNASERQGMLNAAYDALMDIADLLKIPPMAVSLNGTMGLAFGSRGKGRASAHYEPGNIVINLTKTRGAGALAHEWFHGLDNYFQRQQGPGVEGRHGAFITQNPEPYYQDDNGFKLTVKRYNELKKINGLRRPDSWKRVEGVRVEVAEAFTDLVSALNKSPMNKRASLIDKGQSNGYWSRVIERAARSFENYIIAKMQEQGYENDYLANVATINEFSRDPERYPYLLAEELPPVAEAFDNLFATIKTEESTSPSGKPSVRMFSVVQQKADNGDFDSLIAAIEAKEARAKKLVKAHVDPEVGGAVQIGESEYPDGRKYKMFAVFSKDTYPGTEDRPWRVSYFDTRYEGRTPKPWGHANYETLDEAIEGAIRDYVSGPDSIMPARFSVAPSTDSKAFKDWFGDSVVTVDGKPGSKPLVVYHGTRQDFSAFDIAKSGKSTNARSSQLGIFTTDDTKVAPAFGDRIMPLYVSLKNPFEIGHFGRKKNGDLDLNNYQDGFEVLRSAIAKKSGKASWSDVTPDDVAAYRDFMIGRGYDGFAVTTMVDSADQYKLPTGQWLYTRPHTMYIAFRPEQIKSATANVGTYDPNNPDIRFSVAAWHGSPHDFDRFDISKIGTGEGAQAYGHGLYFAGKEDVADWYRRNLARGSSMVVLSEAENKEIPGWLMQSLVSDPSRSNITYHISDFKLRVENSKEELKDAVIQPWLIEDRIRKNTELIEILTKVLRDAEANDGFARFAENKGRKYKVTLAPDEDELLDWDKPLSEQSEKVRNALARSGVGPIQTDADVRAYGYVIEPQQLELSDTTVYKIRRPDGRSVPAVLGGGRLFQSKQEAIDNLNSVISQKDGDSVYRHLSQREGGDRAASALLRSLGIRGIRYLDGSSRNKGDGSYNYVIFDDADVTIDAKFSVAYSDIGHDGNSDLWWFSPEGLTAMKPPQITAAQAFGDPDREDMQDMVDSVHEDIPEAEEGIIRGRIDHGKKVISLMPGLDPDRWTAKQVDRAMTAAYRQFDKDYPDYVVIEFDMDEALPASVKSDGPAPDWVRDVPPSAIEQAITKIKRAFGIRGVGTRKRLRGLGEYVAFTKEQRTNPDPAKTSLPPGADPAQTAPQAKQPEPIEEAPQTPETAPKAPERAQDAQQPQKDRKPAKWAEGKVEPNDPDTFSARKAQVKHDREAWGLPGLQSPERRSWGEAVDKARAQGLPEKALQMAAAIIAKPRALCDIETAGLVEKGMELKNEHKKLAQQIADTRDEAEIAFLKAQYDRVEQEFDLLTKAISASGSEKGRALASQKLTLNQDMDLVSVLNRAKAAKGRELTDKERAKLEALVKENEELQRQLAEAQAQNAELMATRSTRRGGAKRFGRMTQAQKDADLQARARRVAELLKEGCN